MSKPVVPEKRPAFEPAARLAQPLALDPRMKRPVSIVAGAVLVILRGVAGGVWMLTVAFGWQGWLQVSVSAMTGGSADDPELTAQARAIGLAIFLSITGFFVVVEILLGILILFGKNFPRVLVMVFSVISISSAFVSWWTEGQVIRIETTLITVSLDILILLALSSRSSAAYARRFERR